MNRPFSIIAALAVGVGIAAPAAAVPTIYPREGNQLRSLNLSGTTSPVLGDTEDNNHFYVLPPLSGNVALSGIFASTNTGFCPTMAAIQRGTTALENALGGAEARWAQYDAQVKSIELQLSAKERERALLLESPPLAQMLSLEADIADVEDQIANLRIERLDPTTDPDRLDEISAELAQLTIDRRDLKAELAALKRTYRTESLQRARLDAEVAALEAQRGRALTSVLAADREIQSIQDAMVARYRVYSQLEGGLANVNFSSGWQADIVRLRQQNPGLFFNPIETESARFHTTFLPTGAVSPLGMVLGYTVAGRNYDPANPEHAMPSFPDSVGANAQLALAGACPLMFPADWPGSNGVPLFGLSVSYEYPSAFRTTVEATYNLYRVYEYMKQVQSRGGFFRTRTKVSEWETITGDPVMDVKVIDERGTLTTAEIAELEEAAYQRLLDQVLSVMGVPSAPAQPAPNLIPAPEGGAAVIAGGLNTVCGISLWCRGGALVLRGLSAIFGGSTAEQYYKRTYDINVKQTFTRQSRWNRQGLTTYTVNVLR
jgi:hypothetical protein